MKPEFFVQIEDLVRAGRVVEFFPMVPGKRKNRVVCRIVVADKRGWDGWGGTDESEGRGPNCAAALREAMEDVDLDRGISTTPKATPAGRASNSEETQ